MAFSVTLESELLSGERGSPAEMELLKDLPSHDHKNFSRFSQGNWKTYSCRPYIRLKNGEEDPALEIVTDGTSFLLQDLERAVRRQTQVSTKRAAHSAVDEETCRKVPRLDHDASDSAEWQLVEPHPRMADSTAARLHLAEPSRPLVDSAPTRPHPPFPTSSQVALSRHTHTPHDMPV